MSVWLQTNMKGSTIDAMSDAIDAAAVMLFGVSIKYKESANVSTDAGIQLRTVQHVPLASAQ